MVYRGWGLDRFFSEMGMKQSRWPWVTTKRFEVVGLIQQYLENFYPEGVSWE